MIFMDKSGFVLVGIISSLMHELGHIIAVKAKKCSIDRIKLGCVNADIFLNGGNLTDKIIILFSGSMMNFFIAFIFKIMCSVYYDVNIFRTIYLQNLCIGILNLLPIATLDGGCIFLSLLNEKIDSIVALRVYNIVSFIFLIPLFCIGIWILITSEYNFSLMLLVIYLISCILLKKNMF